MTLTQKDLALAEEHMKTLGLSREDAIQLVLDDKAIDKGEKMDFDLTPEQKKVSKKYTGTGTKKRTVYKFDTTKSKKENPVKQTIIAEIEQFLLKNDAICAENVEITNRERQIAFCISGIKYELTLVQKRVPKN